MKQRGPVPVNTFTLYEALKSQLILEDLTPDEYEDRLKELSKILEI